MRLEGTPYRGVLYGGLMLTDEGMKVLEFNVRFGDPETQVVLPRLSSDLAPALLATIDGTVWTCRWSGPTDYCVCVVIASGGYPGELRQGHPDQGAEGGASDPKVEVFHAGTALEDGKTRHRRRQGPERGRPGQRFRPMLAAWPTRPSQMISFEGMHYRTDIGFRALEWQREHGI